MPDNDVEDVPSDGQPYEIKYTGPLRAMLDALPDYERGLLEDEIKEAFSNPEKLAVKSYPLVPVPVEWPDGHDGVELPAMRHPLMLASAVAQISEPTMEHCLYQFREAQLEHPDDRTERVDALRKVALRWTEFIVMQGTHEYWQKWKYLSAMQKAGDYDATARFATDLLAEISAKAWPNGPSLKTGVNDDGHFTITDPVAGLVIISDVSPEDAYEGLYSTLDDFFDLFDGDKVRKFIPDYDADVDDEGDQ